MGFPKLEAGLCAMTKDDLVIILYDMLRGRNYLKKRFLKLITMPEN